MKKYMWLIVLLAIVFIPNAVNAEVVGITQLDCVKACMTNQKVKGITCVGGGFSFDSGEYRLDSDFESENVTIYINNTNKYVIEYCSDARIISREYK